MSTCSKFATYTTSILRYLAAVDPDYSSTEAADIPASNRIVSAGSAAPIHDPSKFEKLSKDLQKYEDHFAGWLHTLLEALNYLAATETAVFLNLCARLTTAGEGLPGSTSRFDE